MFGAGLWAELCSRFLVPEVVPEPQGWRWVSLVLVQLCLTRWDLPHL